jgi:hypothetical protein
LVPRYRDDFETRDPSTGARVVNVDVTVEGSVITQQDLEKVIVDTVVKASTDGYSTGWYRTTGLLSAI